MPEPVTLDSIIDDRYVLDDRAFQRLEAGQIRDVLDDLRDLERILIKKLKSVDPSEPEAFRNRQIRLQNLLDKVRGDIRDAYAQIDQRLETEWTQAGVLAAEVATKRTNGAVMRLVAATAGAAAAAAYRGALATAAPSTGGEVPLFRNTVTKPDMRAAIRNMDVEGAPARFWWRKQRDDLRERYGRTIRDGIKKGESLNDLVKRVRGTRALGFTDGIMQTSRRDAEALIQTGMQATLNESRWLLYQQNKDVIKGVQWRSIIDNKTSAQCMALSGQAWTMDGRPLPGTSQPWPGIPPIHFRCRSTLVPIIKPEKDLGGAESRRLAAAMRELPNEAQSGIQAQITGDLTFEGWLRNRTKAEQVAQLGKGKWELWNAGNISLPDLIDQRARPLTLKQLTALYGEP